MDSSDRFRYIGHGKFIADCFLDQELFKKLTDLVRTDLDQIMLEEQQLSVVSDDGNTQMLMGNITDSDGKSGNKLLMGT